MSLRNRLFATALAVGVTLACRASQARGGCAEVSDVIGYQRCPPGFSGQWAVSPWNFDGEIGYAHDVYFHPRASAPRDASTASPFDSGDARYAGDGVNLHVGLSVGAHFYVPIVMTVTYGTYAFDSGVQPRSGQNFMLGSGLGFGVPFGDFRLRTEIDLGFRSAAFGPKCASDCVTTLSFEPVVALDLFTGPRTYVSVFAGAEPFGPTSLEVGVRLGLATRPRGG